MNRLNRIGLHWALSLVVLVGVSRPAWAADKKPVHLDILLPKDAELEVDGHKTKATGSTRRFESPPMPVGRTYAYALKVVWHGHTLTRRIEVRPEHPLTVDLRKELQALAAPHRPAASFALLVPPALMLRADQHLIFPLRVKRFDFPGTIRIHFADLPHGLTAPEVKLAEGESESNAMLFAAADAPAGTYEIRVAAASGAVKDVATIKVTVAKPQKHEATIAVKPEKKETQIENKPETKPAAPSQPRVEHKTEPTPEKTVERKPEMKPAPTPTPRPEEKPPAAFRVLSPDRVVLHPGQTKYVEVTAILEGPEPLPAESSITLTASPESNLACQMWTAFDGKTNLSARTVGFAVKASFESEPQEQRVNVLVAAGTMKIERTITVTIQPPARKPEAKTELAAPLQLILPGSVALQKGRTAYIVLRVQTKDGSPLAEAPQVMLASPADAGLRFEPWTSSFKAGQPGCTIGIAVRAERHARAADQEVRVRAVVGRSTVEQQLRVVVAGH